MYKNYNKIYWGIIFVLININIGPIDILPNFIGYALMISGLSKLYNETKYKEFLITQTLAVIFLIQSLIAIVYNFNGSEGVTTTGIITSIIFQVMQLIFVFYMYSGTIELLKNYDDKELVMIIEYARRNYTYIVLFTTFLMTFVINMGLNSRDTFLIGYVIVNLFVVLRWVININKVKKFFIEPLQ